MEENTKQIESSVEDINIIDANEEQYDFRELPESDIFADFEKQLEKAEEPERVDDVDDKGPTDDFLEEATEEGIKTLLQAQAEAWAIRAGNGNPDEFKATKYEERSFIRLTTLYFRQKGVSGEQITIYMGLFSVGMFIFFRWMKAERIRASLKRKKTTQIKAEKAYQRSERSLTDDNKLQRSQFQFHKKAWEQGKLLYSKNLSGKYLSYADAIQDPDMIETDENIISTVRHVYEIEKKDPKSIAVFNSRVRDILIEEHGYILD